MPVTKENYIPLNEYKYYCPITHLPFANANKYNDQLEQSDRLYYSYEVRYKGMRHQLRIGRDIFFAILAANESDLTDYQRKLKSVLLPNYLPTFLGELAKSNFSELFGKVIYFECEQRDNNEEYINIKSYVDKKRPEGIYHLSFDEKRNLILKSIKENQKQDFGTVTVSDLDFWTSCYTRSLSEFESHLKKLEKGGLIEVIEWNGIFGLEKMASLTEEGIRYVENLDSLQNKLSMNQNREFSLDIFISHSSSDKKIAQKLIHLLRSAMNIESSRIRCTSVEGFKLEGGVNTDEQLRKEVEDNKLFIGIISKESIQSHYVLYELGARWGLKLPFKPVVCSSDDYSILKAPLSNYNLLSLSNQSDVMQLLNEAATILEKKLEQPSVYLNLIGEMAHEINSKEQSMIHLFEKVDTSEFRDI